MLKEGIDPNAQDSIGNRPLLIAAKKRNPKLLEILIGGGAKVDADSVASRPCFLCTENRPTAQASVLLNALSHGKVKTLRLKRKLTQSELAQKINATASYISQLERNLISPSIDSLILLSSELQVEPGYFLSVDRSDFDNGISRKSQQHPVTLANIEWNAVKCYLLSKTGINRRMQPMHSTFSSTGL
jgi:transcriptional regulator with XRE-family HTH domain